MSRPENIEKASSRVGSVPWGEAEDFVREFKETLASRFGNKIFNPSVPKDWGGSVNGEFLCLCTWNLYKIKFLICKMFKNKCIYSSKIFKNIIFHFINSQKLPRLYVPFFAVSVLGQESEWFVMFTSSSTNLRYRSWTRSVANGSLCLHRHPGCSRNSLAHFRSV